jgi:hypothetical protein
LSTREVHGVVIFVVGKIMLFGVGEFSSYVVCFMANDSPVVILKL